MAETAEAAAAARKSTRYTELCRLINHFLSLALEEMGRLSAISGYTRDRSFFVQHVSMTTQSADSTTLTPDET